MTKSNYRQSEQDYLESILLLSEERGFVHRVEVANKMNVSQAAVNKAMKLLQEKGYLYEDGKHLFLTEQGETYAREIF
jgi:Mn-dependent DtxR family transcriptional regulator